MVRADLVVYSTDRSYLHCSFPSQDHQRLAQVAGLGFSLLPACPFGSASCRELGFSYFDSMYIAQRMAGLGWAKISLLGPEYRGPIIYLTPAGYERIVKLRYHPLRKWFERTWWFIPLIAATSIALSLLKIISDWLK